MPDGQTSLPTSGVCLTQIYPPHDDDDDTAAETDIDIIAIHGLDTKSPDTWIWKSKVPPQNVNWLADKGMLPNEVKKARIFTCDWPSSLFERSDLIQKKIEELARLLLDGIKRRPLAPNDGTEGENRPILFIASCLGGIILMKALVMANYEYRSIRTSTRAIIFLATPFGGTSFQDVAKWAEPGLEAWASIHGQKVSKMLENVRGATFDLDELVRGFTQLCQDENHPYRVMTFYEMGMTNLYSKAIPYLRGGSKRLVDQSSATLHIVPAPLPLDRPHITMNKFWGPEDSEYQKVAGKVREFTEWIRKGTLLSRVDDYMRHKYYTAKRLMIERLSGDPLGMDQCYINLAIVEKPGENTHLLDGDPTALNSSPFSIFARQRVETPDRTIQFELATIFNQRREHDGRVTEPRRILIRGRAGIGKSTLCKKMMHEFLEGDRWKWKQHFDRILWLPLRRLKMQPEKGWNLEKLFYHEYFYENGSDEGRSFAKELFKTVRDTHSGARTLFILDGLDEVSGTWNRDDPRFRCLLSLLDQSNIIITSRPSVQLPTDLRDIDLELETIGFHPDQVMEYIEKSFLDPITGKTNQIKVDAIDSFLQSHWLLRGLVRIPIQLDALCYIWEDLDLDNVPDNMTGIYNSIVRRLWKKDIMQLKTENGKPVTESEIDISHVEDLVSQEICFLEGLAFTGLHNDVINVTSRDREVISKHFKPRGLLLNKTLPHLSFLRTSEISSKECEYHFLHLTFQEYFAAQYFVRQWKTNERLKCVSLKNKKMDHVSPNEFLRKQKYSARYDVFWRFVAGLLDAESGADGPEDILNFFNRINAEPLDLLGPAHQRLVMHCLSEVANDLPIRPRLEQTLSDWMLFECELAGSSFLGRESEYPEEAIRVCLTEGCDEGKINALTALQYRDAHLSDEMLECLTVLVKDCDKNIRRATVEALGHQSRLPDTVMAVLITAVKDEDRPVSAAAIQSIKNQSTISDVAREGLTALLSDRLPTSNHTVSTFSFSGRVPNWWSLSDATQAAVIALFNNNDRSIRSAVAQAFWSSSNLPDKVVVTIAALLQDRDVAVRCAAASAFWNQPRLPENAVAALVASLKDDHQDVRSEAAQTLGRRSELPEAAIAALVALFKDKHDSVRCNAAGALREQSELSEAAIAALVALLKDKHGTVRYIAAGALRKQLELPEAAIVALIALLKDKHDRVRYNAVGALRKQLELPEAAIVALTALLKDEDASVRLRAADALGKQLKLPEAAIVALTALLKDEYFRVRLRAADALATQPKLPQAAIEATMALLEDENLSVPLRAFEALGNQPKLPQAVIEAIMALLKDDHASVRLLAATTLGEDGVVQYNTLPVSKGQSKLSGTAKEASTTLIRGEHSVPPSQAVLTSGGQVKLWNTEFIALISLPKQQDSYVRSHLAHALGLQSNLPAIGVSTLIALQKDNNAFVRFRVAEALGRQSKQLGTSRVLPHPKDREAWSASAIVPEYEPKLLDTAIATLIELLQDQDQWVQDSAKNGLKRYVQLSDTAIGDIIMSVKNNGGVSLSYAVEILGQQLRLSETAMVGLAMMFKNEKQHRQSSLAKVWRQSKLLERTLEAIGMSLEPESSAKTVTQAFRNPRCLEHLYGVLLHCAIEEQLSLYIDQGCCIINEPSGLRIATLGDDMHGELLASVRKARQHWNIHGRNLWDNPEGGIVLETPPDGVV